jgi:flagellar hook assembly protein FlgD
MVFESLMAGSTIDIYTITGEKVIGLADSTTVGSIVWNGNNEAGAKAASGIYVAVIKNGTEVKKIKIAVER